MSKRSKAARTRVPGTGEQGRKKLRDVFVARPFEGLPDEARWIALRELVPAASAPLRLNEEYTRRYPDRSVTLVTILPMALPAMTRPDGRVLIGIQRHQQSGDVSRDLAASLLAALECEPGQPVPVQALPGPGPRLQDVIELEPLDITLHSKFDFWLDEEAADDATVQASLERANASLYPTVALAAAHAAYWCRVAERAHVRWVLADDEDRALDALARLAAEGTLTLGDTTRFAGMFRAHGLLVPVWDLPVAPEAEAWEEPLAEFAKRYSAAFATEEPLTAAQRRSRQGLLGRQLTLR